MRKIVLIALLMLLLVGSYACGTDDIKGKGATLVHTGNNYYTRGRFDQAALAYQKFVEQNPDSPYRKAAILGLADCYYKDKEYFQAILYYERFAELYPLDPLTPRAQFYMGMSYYYDSNTADRDQTQTMQAKKVFDFIQEEYPDHELAPYAKKYGTQMAAIKTSSELEIARFYLRVNKSHSAITRLQEYIERHPDSDELPEAMYLLGEGYYKEQSYKKAALIFTMVIEKYPGAVFASKAAAMAKKIKLKK